MAGQLVTAPSTAPAPAPAPSAARVTKQFQIYVVRCEDNYWYVGKTTRPIDARFAEHVQGTASAWTRAHPPIEIAQTFSPDPQDVVAEDAHVRRLMAKHGVDRVRGGAFSALELPEYQRLALEKEMRSAHDQCFRCGDASHKIRDCPHAVSQTQLTRAGGAAASTAASPATLSAGAGGGGGYASKRAAPSDDACYRCGRTSHWAADCYARTDVDGRPLEARFGVNDGESDESDQSDSEESWHGDSVTAAADSCVCLRCGRPGHTVHNCFARTGVDGRRI